jgi:uncharacterized membrane protein YqaE (UPF0057 family)
MHIARNLVTATLPKDYTMRYLLALLLPPIAVFICGKPIQGIINIILTLCFYVPGAIHALLVVHGYHADKRTDKIIDAIKNQDGE